MSRYSPTVLPDDRDDPGTEAFISGLREGPERLRQMRADRRARDEDEYRRSRREKTDPLEDALRAAELYDKGVVPAGGGAPTLADAVDGERGRGADLLSGRAQFGDRGLSTGRGVAAPGSFNPVTGSFNSPFDRGGERVPLGGGYELDTSRTERGRTETRQRRMIDAMVARGVPLEEAETEVLGGLEGAISEHFHPGPFHPRTMADALDYEKQLIRARGDEDVRVAKERGDKVKLDPRLKERRDSWERQLGPPRNQLEQDVLDFLADGEDANEIPDYFPESKKAAVRTYLSGKEADVNRRRRQSRRLFDVPLQ